MNRAAVVYVHVGLFKQDVQLAVQNQIGISKRVVVGIHIPQRFCHIACTEEGLACLLQHADRTELLVLKHFHHLVQTEFQA